MDLVYMTMIVLVAGFLFWNLLGHVQEAREKRKLQAELRSAHAAAGRLGFICSELMNNPRRETRQMLYNEAQNLVPFVLGGRYQEYHHTKRGTDYRMLIPGDIRLNFAGRIRDGDEMCLYQDLDTGRLSVRSVREFLDGRFQLLSGEDAPRGGVA